MKDIVFILIAVAMIAIFTETIQCYWRYFKAMCNRAYECGYEDGVKYRPQSYPFPDVQARKPKE